MIGIFAQAVGAFVGRLGGNERAAPPARIAESGGLDPIVQRILSTVVEDDLRRWARDPSGPGSWRRAVGHEHYPGLEARIARVIEAHQKEIKLEVRGITVIEVKPVDEGLWATLRAAPGRPINPRERLAQYFREKAEALPPGAGRDFFLRKHQEVIRAMNLDEIVAVCGPEVTTDPEIRRILGLTLDA